LLRKVVDDGLGDEDAHRRHPEEGGNQGVLDQVSQYDAAKGSNKLFVILWIQPKKLNSNKKIAEEYIEQESNSYLPKQISPQFQNGQIRTNCEENEKG